MKLHWLPAHFHLIFNMLHLFKLNGISPLYLDDLICKYRPSHSLHSSDANFLFVPSTFAKVGNGRFSVCGSLVWNNLPYQDGLIS